MAKGRRNGRVLIFVSLILILLIVVIGVFARFSGIFGPSNPPSQGSTTPQATAIAPQDLVNIIMTTQDVSRGKEITESLVTAVPIPRKDFIEGSFFTDTKDVVGSRARYDLKAHTPISEALVIAAGKQGSMASFDIPKGMVAISIPISKLSSISNGLQNGDHVNVIASLLLVDLDMNFQSKLPNNTGLVIAPGPVDPAKQTNVTSPIVGSGTGDTGKSAGRIDIDPSTGSPIYLVPSEPQRPRLISQTLIQDSVVLQMGTFDAAARAQAAAAAAATAPQTAQPSASTQGQAAPQPTPVPTVTNDVVTLIVTPQDAITLNYLMLSGASLNLVLRNSADDQKIATEAVTLQFVLDRYAIPNPAKLPYGMEPRINKFPESINPFPVPNNTAAATPTPAP